MFIIAIYITITQPLISTTSLQKTFIDNSSIVTIDLILKYILSNEIIIYSISKITSAIVTIISEYSKI